MGHTPAGHTRNKSAGRWSKRVGVLAAPSRNVITKKIARTLELSTLPLFPSRKFTEFPTGLRLLFYSTTPPFARSSPRSSLLS